MFGEWLTALLIWLGLSQPLPPLVDEAALVVEVRELDDKAIDVVLERILKGIYQAFSGDGEEAIYDGLARVVDGGLLSDLYLQQRRASAYGIMSGVVTEIVDVELFESEAQELASGYAIRAGWRVFGRLEHETHAHERVNIYQANLAIAPVRGQWRLTAFDLDSVERENLDEFVGGE